MNKAVEYAKENSAVLLVAKLSRLSRAGFSAIAFLEEHKVEYIEAVSPHDTPFVKGIKLLMAKEENDERKDNIQRGIDQIKRNIKEKGYHIAKSGRKITSLGNPGNLTEKARKISKDVRRKNALENKNNLRAKAVIELLVKQDKTLKEIADYLNEREFLTSRGVSFEDATICHLLKLYNIKRDVKKVRRKNCKEKKKGSQKEIQKTF